MESAQIIYKSKLDKEYELEIDKSKILLKINFSSPLINISISFLDNVSGIYKNSYDKESLFKINKFFKMFDSIEEIMPIFINLIDNKNILLIK